MNDIREIVRENLVKLRKRNKLTQMELAEKIGYSDKAISRWETGEVTPDVETLARLSEIYGVSPAIFFDRNVDALPTGIEVKRDRVKRAVIMLLSVALIWYAAIFIHSVLSQNELSYAWMAFIWAIPASFLALAIFSVRWGLRVLGVVCFSVFGWTFILGTYLQLIDYNLFLLFPAGAPIQAVIILSYFLKSKR